MLIRINLENRTIDYRKTLRFSSEPTVESKYRRGRDNLGHSDHILSTFHLPEMKEHAKQMFKVECLTIDGVDEEIEELDEIIRQANVDGDDCEGEIAARQKLIEKSEKLQKIDELASVDDLG